MNIGWNVIEENRQVKVRLVYNMYLGTKRLYVDNAKILKSKVLYKKGKITFKYNDKDYSIRLIPENFGYTGVLVTPLGAEISCEVEAKRKKKASLWIIPFTIINMSIPIISIEAFTPWIIGIGTSYFATKICQEEHVSVKMKVGLSAVISILAWIMYYMFYLTAKVKSGSTGFLPF